MREAGTESRKHRGEGRGGGRSGGGGKGGRTSANAGVPASGPSDAVRQVIGQIERAHGKGAIMRLGDGPAAEAAPVISTGSLGLDIALGIGGLPRGRIVEVFGPESSGKTTIALHAIAEAQRAGGISAFIDAEHALDVRYAAALGVDTADLLLTQPDHGEQALEIVDTLIRSGAVDLIVVDSVAALVPKAELEGEMGDSHVGLHARLMSQAMRKITANAAKHGTMVLFINQLRMKIGVMFGSPETTTGGNALKFYTSVRLDVRRIGTLKSGDEVTGNRTRIKVVKNKMAAPFRQVELDLVHGKGIYAAGELLDLAVEAKLVEKRGAWYACEGESIGQGREAAARFFEEHPEVMARLRQELLTSGGIGAPPCEDEDTARESPPPEIAEETPAQAAPAQAAPAQAA